MKQQAKLIESKVLSDGAVAVRARCCGDPSTDSWHTCYITASKTDAEIEAEFTGHCSRVEEQHAARQRTERIAVRLIGGAPHRLVQGGALSLIEGTALCVFFLWVLCAQALAQNMTTVSASNIQNLAGTKLSSGTFYMQGTDGYNTPISFQCGGGGQVVRAAYSAAISSGAITSFSACNPAYTTPAGIYYHIWIVDTTTGSATNGQTILNYAKVQFSGSTFSFDAYSPGAAGLSLPANGSVPGNLSVGGNASIAGTVSAGSVTTAGLTSTGDSIYNNGGSTTQAYFGTTGPVSPLSINIQGGASSFSITSPVFYSSYFDTTVGSGGNSPAGCTTQQLWSPCDEIPNRIDFTNRQTSGVIPNLVGLGIAGSGFASNTPVAGYVGNWEQALGLFMADSATANVVHMRDMNPYMAILGLPTQLAGNGQTRAAFLVEGDLQNSSGADAVWNGTVGNYTGGISLVSAGNSNTIGVAVSGVAQVAGKGWLDGLYITDVVNCGICIYDFNASPYPVVSPTVAEQIASGGTYGLVVGSGTISRPYNGDAIQTGPSTYGILLDSYGTPGTSESQNSQSLNFFAKNSSASASMWRMRETSDTNFHATFTSGTADFILGSNGNFVQTGNTHGFFLNGSYTSTIAATSPSGNRTATIPDGNSATVMAASLTTTASSSDNVTVTGMTSSGHCSLTATNSSAATNIATTYVSAKTSNQITVTHTATASMTYDVLCTPN